MTASSTTASHPRSSGGSAPQSTGLPVALCTFWLGDRCYGLDVALAYEVVVADAPTPVPLARGSLLGLINLRGTPLAVVDTAGALGLEGAATKKDGFAALVVRHDDLAVALAIERMEAVVEGGRGHYSPSVSAEEHPVVQGLLEVDGRVVTVLEPTGVVARLEQLRYAHAGGG